jgi:formylglycine-generating enzyme required for sulfatase activity
LPSEAEWEYAARAGTATSRYWGDDPGERDACRFANAADQTVKEKFGWSPVLSCRDGFVFTAPVGSYESNVWKLRDMLGNVWEWVEDCWHESYAGAPGDSSAWIEEGCPRRVLRGGSWGNGPGSLRSADRDGYGPEFRSGDAGFRVARMLTP